jgi:Zn-dependent peptidase ImmA (M78 family)
LTKGNFSDRLIAARKKPLSGGGDFMPTFNPYRFKEIRTVRKMTLEDVAGRIGVSKQAVAKYECGSIPSAEILEKIRTHLKVPGNYLNKESIRPKGVNSALFFRTARSTKRSAKAFAEIQVRWGYEALVGINLFEPLPPVHLPEFHTGHSIPEKASFLRNYWGMGTAPVEDITALLERNGIFVFVIDTSEFNIDAYSRIMNDIPIIVLNKDRGTAVRWRFSLAHELGHLVLHRSLSDEEFEKRGSDIEHEANLFAGNFLLPEESFGRSVIAPRIDHFINLKKPWKVSIAAMIYRCKDLGILEDQKVKQLRIRISKENWRDFEPLDDEIEFEGPRYVSEQAQKHLIGKNSIERFLNAVRLPVFDIERLCSLPRSFFSEYYEAGSRRERDRQLNLFN